MIKFKRGEKLNHKAGDNFEVVTYIRSLKNAGLCLVVNQQGLIKTAYSFDLYRSEQDENDRERARKNSPNDPNTYLRIGR